MRSETEKNIEKRERINEEVSLKERRRRRIEETKMTKDTTITICMVK